MSRYFAFDHTTGRHEDIVVKRSTAAGSVVMLGSRSIGQIFPPTSGCKGWDAVSHAQPPYLFGLRLVRGFRTRWDAVEYLLQAGVHLPENRCVPALDHHPLGYHGCNPRDPDACFQPIT